MLTELKKKQEVGFALQPGLQEKKAQLKFIRSPPESEGFDILTRGVKISRKLPLRVH